MSKDDIPEVGPDEITMFDRIPQHAMRIARCWPVIPGTLNVLCPTSTRKRQPKRKRADQICFSGIWTTSPSNASDTLIWQVRRERAGSGSKAKSSMSSSIASTLGSFSTQSG